MLISDQSTKLNPNPICRVITIACSIYDRL